MVENTKEYVCRAMVSLVDHFGCVSDNLDYLIHKNTTSFWDANLRIDCLKQVQYNTASHFLIYMIYHISHYRFTNNFHKGDNLFFYRDAHCPNNTNTSLL